MLDVTANVASGQWAPDVDWQALSEIACGAAILETPYGELSRAPFPCEIAIRLTDNEDVQALNAQYRGKDKATNVLSFPMLSCDQLTALSAGPDADILLGDIVLADDVVAKEATEKAIAVTAHVSHLIVHGLLHLLGYDHETDHDADQMENIERAALARIGISDPYASLED